MKKIKSKKSFDIIQPIGIAGINKAYRLDKITFEPVKTTFTDRIQSFYQLVSQSPRVLYP